MFGLIKKELYFLKDSLMILIASMIVIGIGASFVVLCQEIVQDKKRKFYYPARTSFSLDWLARYNFSNSLGDKYPQ